MAARRRDQSALRIATRKRFRSARSNAARNAASLLAGLAKRRFPRDVQASQQIIVAWIARKVPHASMAINVVRVGCNVFPRYDILAASGADVFRIGQGFCPSIEVLRVGRMQADALSQCVTPRHWYSLSLSRRARACSDVRRSARNACRRNSGNANARTAHHASTLDCTRYAWPARNPTGPLGRGRRLRARYRRAEGKDARR